MSHPPTLFRGTLLLPDREIPGGQVRISAGRITEVGPATSRVADETVIDAADGYIAPGFVDLHIHGGDGGDFMDGTDDAFMKAITSHARHGTTSMAITTTVGSVMNASSASTASRSIRRPGRRPR